MSDLRQRVIRLAHERPELREHLLPLVAHEKKADVVYPTAPIRGTYGSFINAADETIGYGFEIVIPPAELAEAKDYFERGRQVITVEWDGGALHLKWPV